MLAKKRNNILSIEDNHNSAEDLRFRGIGFQFPLVFQPSPYLSGNERRTTLGTSY